MGAPTDRHMECPQCDGLGTLDVEVQTHDGPVTEDEPCPKCEGTGWVEMTPAEYRSFLFDWAEMEHDVR